MRGSPARWAWCALALVAVSRPLAGQVDTVPGVPTPVVTTRHQITLGGRPLAYTARAGLLPIRHNETGEPRAWVFFVSYTVAPAPGRPRRPLTFAWNGGPGANALLLHMSAIGPRRLQAGESHGLVLEDNQATWLDETDLVFVDPVGTGFSRPARPSYGDDFYGVLGDLAATREFIRTYRTRFAAWDQPLYLAGESYGVWRAAGVAEAMERADEGVAGVVLISGGIPMGPVVSDEMRAALFIPTRTASAFHHNKLTPDLQPDRGRAVAEAEEWARTVYGPALAKRESLTDAERSAIVAQLARFTGLDAALINRDTLIVDRQFLMDNLLKDRGQGSLGRFDTRQVGGSAPLNRGEAERRRALINGYLRRDLGFATDLVYQGLEAGYASTPGGRGVGARWKWDQGPPGVPVVARNTDAPPGGTPPWLRRTMEINTRLRAFVATGLFDSLNSCPMNTWLLAQVEPAFSSRITFRCYEGGHMMYEDREARFGLKRDIVGFYSRFAELEQRR